MGLCLGLAWKPGSGGVRGESPAWPHCRRWHLLEVTQSPDRGGGDGKTLGPDSLRADSPCDPGHRVLYPTLASVSPTGLCGRCTGVAVPLRVVPSPTGLPSKRGPGAIAQSPGREAALAWASLAQRFPASSVLAREGASCGSVGDVRGSWLASAPLSQLHSIPDFSEAP